MHSLDIAEKKLTSALCGALRRVGAQMRDIEGVEGEFVADTPLSRGRISGVLQTHDAMVRVSFDSEKVALPTESNFRMQVTGKVWLETESSTFVVMVNHWKNLDQECAFSTLTESGAIHSL